jgi:hypothetical protein
MPPGGGITCFVTHFGGEVRESASPKCAKLRNNLNISSFRAYSDLRSSIKTIDNVNYFSVLDNIFNLTYDEAPLIFGLTPLEPVQSRDFFQFELDPI